MVSAAPRATLGDMTILQLLSIAAVLTGVVVTALIAIIPNVVDR